MVDAALAPAGVHDRVPGAVRWATGLLGVLSLVAGVLLLLRPDDSLETLAVVSGIFMVLDSAFELGGSLRRDHEARGLAAVIGVLGIIAGILLIRHPIESVTAIALIIGIWLTGAGSLRLARAITGGRRATAIALGVVEMVAGLVLVASPGIGLKTLALLAGLSFLLNGLVLLAESFLLGRATS